MKKYHATVGQDLSIRQHCCRIPINALSMFLFGTKDERKRGGGSVHYKVRHSEHSPQEWGRTAVSRTECWQKNTFGRGGEHQYKSHFLPSSCHMCSWIIKIMQTSTSPTLTTCSEMNLLKITLIKCSELLN